MTQSVKLALEYLQNSAANQVLANTTFALLDQLVQAGAVDKDLSSPPGSPANGALYIVGSSPTGAWSGKAGQLAFWLTSVNAWSFIVPKEGFLVHVNDEDDFYKFNGSSWEVFSGGSSGGGIASIVAGAGIAVDATDPENPIISATGSGGMSNPMTAAGDIIIGGSSGTPQRLNAGSNGQALLIVSGVPAWGAIYSSPLTTTGDLVYASSGATAARLAVGSNGQVLTVSGGVPTWQNSAAGFSNPMTTRGDIITGGTSGSPQRLAKGTSGQMLVAGSADPSYSNSAILGGYAELLETMSGTAIDVSSTNVKKKVMAANTTFTITGATSGQSHSFTLYLEGGATYTVSWPGSVQWIGGSVPTLAAKCRITGETLDGGTTWLLTYGGSYT